MEENTYCIYCHTSPIGKRYIGQTKFGDNPNKRWKDGKHYFECSYFFNAILKYGWDNFEHEILENGLTFEQANEREKYWINFYDTTNPEQGYNIENGGYNSPTSEETKKKLSNSHLERREQTSLNKKEFYNSPAGKEAKKKISASLKEFYQTEKGKKIRQQNSERRKAMRGENNPNFGKPLYAMRGENNPNFGKPLADETKEKLHKNSKIPFKLILCVETGIVYEGSHEVERLTGLFRSSINNCCKGKQKTCGGYHWKYVDDEVNQ